MTEENDSGRFNLSRRKALAGIGGIGVAAGLGGLGTTAMFGDSEETAATFTAGELDLKIKAKATHHDAYGNEVTSTQELQPEGGYGDDNDAVNVPLELEDIKPGDSGCVQVCFEVQDNPAWVWMRGFTENTGENGYTEPEVDAEGDAAEDDWGGWEQEDSVEPGDFEEQAEGSIEGDRGDLSTLIKVFSFYDSVPPNCQPDNRFMLEETLGVNLNERRLRANSELDDAAGQFGENGTLLDAVRVEEYGGDTSKDALSPASSNAVSSLASEKDPQDAYTTSAVDAQAGASTVYKDPYNPVDGPQFSSSDFDAFEQHLVDNDYYPAEGDTVGQGDGQQEYDGFDPSGDCVTLAWQLPKSVGNIVQGDSAKLHLELFAQQARSNAVPESPFSFGT